MAQYLDDSIGIEYGIKTTWRIALVAPDGEILFSKGLGYSSTVSATSVALHYVRDFLPTTNWCGKELFLMAPTQMLGLSELRKWHNFRLAWGDGDPDAANSELPNGKDLDWTFYYCANGCDNVITSGRLPEEWWDWDDDDRYHYLQNVL